MLKLRRWLILKLGGYVKGETYCVVKDGLIYFQTDKDTWTVGINNLNANEIIVGK